MRACEAKACKGVPVELGFLLVGTRKYQCNVEHFPLGAQLQIEAIRSLEDESGMGVLSVTYAAKIFMLKPV